MIFETPQQSEEVLKVLYSNNYRDRPIKDKFPGFEECLLAFHPFLLVKDGHEAQIRFQTGKWPSKKQINEHCEKLSWSDFLRISEISDLGPRQLIAEAIHYISLEGFYCDSQTCESWSFEVFPEDNRIDWGMKN